MSAAESTQTPASGPLTLWDPSEAAVPPPLGVVSAPARERRDPGPSCGGCQAAWTGTRACHCGAVGCHQTFAGLTLFDAHRNARGEHGSCSDPATVVNAAGERIMEFRDGMWRGPEMSDEAKAKAFGGER